ncbi:MAG: metal ABC transporter permease, partial [candidate division Zixibacteria bacterium]|nr:metal ABC transporter permease [candidate division Zixibacteria bacterium]
AMIIGLVSIHRKEREDTIISVIWSVGMAVGILFISQTPGYNRDLLSYLFGNILMVSPNEILMIGILDTLIVVLGILFYNQLLAVCFDEEFAALRGINVKLFYLMLLGMTALTVVLLITVVGIIMVIALLTIPAAIASLFSRTLFQTMIIAVILSMLFTVSGLAISYGPDLPAGATIIILACVSYIIAALISKIAKPNTA